MALTGKPSVISDGGIYRDVSCTAAPKSHAEIDRMMHRLFDNSEPEALDAVPTPLDVQIGGDHYKTLGEYQPWEVLKAWLTPEEFRGYMKGTAIAYLARERQKGGTEDIAKATHTLQGFLHFVDSEPAPGL